MTTRRRLAAVAVGLMLAACVHAAACSAVDPNPPNPHTQADPLVAGEAPDASDAAVRP